MQPADIRSLSEAYQGIYKEKVDLTEENIDEDLLDESFDELVDELIEEGYSEEEAIEIVDEATDLYIDSVLCEVSDSYYDSAVRASKKAARGIDKAARQKRRAGQVRYAKRKVGDAIKSVKAKAKGAVAGAQIAGSIAKDEARRAGRKAAHAVTSAPGKAKATVDRKKKETKRGIKGFIKRQAEKVVKRMSEGYDEPKMHSAVKRVMTTQPAAKGRAASRLHSKYSMRSKGNTAGETDGPGPNAPKRSGRKGRGAETDRGSGNAAKRRMSEGADQVNEMAPMQKAQVTASGQQRYSTGDGKTTGPTGAKLYNTVRSLKNKVLGNSHELEGDQLVEKLKASGLFSEQEIAKIAEQMTTVTSVPPAGDSFRTGSNTAPKPPTLPAPKKKPEPKLGAGVPGFKYGGATGP